MASYSTTPTRWKTRAVATALLSLVATLGLLLSSETVKADPSISTLEKEIDAAWNKLEPLLEQHNATRAKLAAERKNVEKLRKALDPLKLELRLATARIGEFAAYLYPVSYTHLTLPTIYSV